MAHLTAAGLATALAALLLFVQPWRGHLRYQRLVAASAVRADARLRHYGRGIVGEWTIVVLIVVIGLLAGRSASSIGLGSVAHIRSFSEIVTAPALLLVGSALVFMAPHQGIQRTLQAQARGFLALLPRTARERWLFAGVAVTAGICEEVIFRGFGLAYVRWLWPSAPQWALVVTVGAGFGLAHLYQGPRGVVLTGIIGGYLTWTVFASGSLWPAMLIHALIDLRVLALRRLDLPPSPEPAARGPAQSGRW